VCRNTYNDTTEEAKLHGLAVSSLLRRYVLEFPTLSHNASHVRGGGRTSRRDAPTAAREIYRPERGLPRRNTNIIT